MPEKCSNKDQKKLRICTLFTQWESVGGLKRAGLADSEILEIMSNSVDSQLEESKYIGSPKIALNNLLNKSRVALPQ